MAKNDIFLSADKKTTKLLKVLEGVQKYLPAAQAKVPQSLVQSGYTQYKGLILPLDTVSHRYLFEFYESNLWRAYAILFRTVFEEKEARLSEFTFRSLMEMGIDECFILFDQSVKPEERQKYILLKVLVDYGSIETTQQATFNKWFTKLLEEEKTFIDQNFTDKQKTLIQSLGANINKSQEQGYTKALIAVRRLCMQFKEEIISRHEKAGNIVITNAYRRMKSGEAHTTHGNVFLLPHRLKQQSRENHLFRVYMYLLYTGTEALTRLVGFLKNDELSKEADAVLTELSQFKQVFSAAWASNSQV